MSTSYQPNQPISLAKTKITELDGQAADVPVEVTLRLSPSPTVLVQSKQLPSSMFRNNSFNISLANGARFKAACGLYNSRTSEGFLIPVRQPVDVFDKHLPLDSVRFGVINLPIMYGSQDKWAEDEQQFRLIPHIRFEVPGWIVEVTGVSNIHDIEQTLKQSKGYGVTYKGTIARSDRNCFFAKDVEELLTALRSFISFVRGASCTLALVEGIDQTGQQSWLRWGVHNVESWGNYRSWFRWLDGADTFSNMFSGFWHLFASEARDSLLRAIDWYLQSNVISPYIGIILTVAALELLSNQVLERQRHRNERTGDFVREALDDLKIPSDVPEGCKSLQRIKTWKHSPHAIVVVRNDLIHPKKKLNDVSDFAIHEAWNLGQWCIEMILLRMFEYRGSYVNRLADWGEFDQRIQLVPWVN